MSAIISFGSVIIVLIVSKQLLASVRVSKYVSAIRFITFGVLSPLDQLQVYGSVPLFARVFIDPLASPKQVGFTVLIIEALGLLQTTTVCVTTSLQLSPINVNSTSYCPTPGNV